MDTGLTMKNLTVLIFATVLVSCAPSAENTKSERREQLVFPKPKISMSRNMAISEISGIKPTKKNGIWTMRVRPEYCNDQDYGDGRGESDCTNGNLRSQIQGTPIEPEQTVEYSFEINIPKDFSYRESLNYRPYGSIEVAQWQHVRAVKNHLYELRLSPNSGVLFDGKTCIKPSEYGEWAKVVFQVNWTEKDDGFLKVTCNERLIVSRTGQTLVPKYCDSEIKPQCKPAMLQSSNPINWWLGIQFYGFGPDWRDYGRQSPFLPFKGSELSIQTRNISVKRTTY